jgi:hypothetical protein
MARITPAFEVEELSGKVTRTKYKYEERDTGRTDAKGNPIKSHVMKEFTEEEPAGYMVYFARGHSIRVPNDLELKRLGLDRSPYLSDPTGEMQDEDIAQQYGQQMSLKEQAAAEVRRNSRGKAASKSSDQLANPEGD